jgi:hypothetical protein
MPWGAVRADESKSQDEICIQYRISDKMGRRTGIVSHHFKLKPGELSSLAFQVEAVGNKKVRVTVQRENEGQAESSTVEITSAVYGGPKTRTTVKTSGDKPLEVSSLDIITVYYVWPDRRAVLTSVRGREDGRVDALIPWFKDGRGFQPYRYSAKFNEDQGRVSVVVSGVPQ